MTDDIKPTKRDRARWAEIELASRRLMVERYRQLATALRARGAIRASVIAHQAGVHWQRRPH